MIHLVIKFAVTAGIVVAVSEIAKRSTIFGALVASLPLTSILALIWLYNDTQELSKISDLSFSIFWMVLPSLVFFLLLPAFIRLGLGFYSSLISASLCMAVVYYGFTQILSYFNIKLF